MITDKILSFLCMSLGVSYMWSFSTIFKPVRNLVSKIPIISIPLLCPECSAFWFGLLTSFLYNPIALLIFTPSISNILCGVITYFFASILYKKIFLQ